MPYWLPTCSVIVDSTHSLKHTTMKCPNCNATDHQPEAKFCLHCGASLLAIQCPKCKATNHNPNARFCFHCGAPLALMVCPQCNTIDHQLGSRFCLRCGTQLVHTINTSVELWCGSHRPWVAIEVDMGFLQRGRHQTRKHWRLLCLGDDRGG